MSHLLSECPNCHRTSLAGASRRPSHCRVCGTPLTVTGAQKEAEVRDRLYGPRVSLGTVTRVDARAR